MNKKNFGEYIKTLLNTSYKDVKLSTPAKVYLNNLCIFIISKIATLTNSLMRTSNKKTVSLDAVRECTLLFLEDDFGEYIVTEATNSVNTFIATQSEIGVSMSIAKKSGLIFAPSKVHYYFSQYSCFSRFAKHQRIFLAAVVEALLKKIIENGVSIMKNEKRTTFSLKDVTQAIFSSPPLFSLVKDITNLTPENTGMSEFLSYEQPKTKKEQEVNKRPKMTVENTDISENLTLNKMSKNAIKRLGYRAGLRRFGDAVTKMCLLYFSKTLEILVKYCLVSMKFNNRITIFPEDVKFALENLEGGTILMPVKKYSLICKKTVKEKKGRKAKTQATKTKEWKKKVEYYQSMTSSLFFARDSFKRLIKEASGDRVYTEDVDTESVIGVEKIPNLNALARDMMQAYCEHYLVTVLKKANEIAVYNSRQTVQPKDVLIAFNF